jgi:hypothetical protein
LDWEGHNCLVQQAKNLRPNPRDQINVGWFIDFCEEPLVPRFLKFENKETSGLQFSEISLESQNFWF